MEHSPHQLAVHQPIRSGKHEERTDSGYTIACIQEKISYVSKSLDSRLWKVYPAPQDQILRMR